MRWYNPMDAAFAARIHDKSKFARAAKFKPKKLGLNFENMKNVTPTKFNGCVDIEKVGYGK
jgi:hypothetical protein